MIILEHNDPNFVVLKDFNLGCVNGMTVNFEQDDPISLHKNEDGSKIFVGDYGSTIELNESRLIDKFLENIHPCSFSLQEDTDLDLNEGSECLKPELLEVEMTSSDKRARISLASDEIVSKSHIISNSIF